MDYKDYIWGIDLGGTNLRIGIVDPNPNTGGVIEGVVTYSTPDFRDNDELTKKVLEIPKYKL